MAATGNVHAVVKIEMRSGCEVEEKRLWLPWRPEPELREWECSSK